MSIPSYKEHMIASAVWFHLERGVDISDIAHIIHQTIPSVSQNAIGKLFGIKSISTYLGKLDTKESIKKPLEDIFIERELKLVF